jgi:hypothetical protein
MRARFSTKVFVGEVSEPGRRKKCFNAAIDREREEAEKTRKGGKDDL